MFFTQVRKAYCTKITINLIADVQFMYTSLSKFTINIVYEHLQVDENSTRLLCTLVTWPFFLQHLVYRILLLFNALV